MRLQQLLLVALGTVCLTSYT